jgi:protein-export membrane protein SecD
MKNVGRLVTSIVFVALLVGAAVAGFLTSVKPLLGLDLEGGLSVILRGPPGTQKAVMDQALDHIRNRVDALGVAEPDITLIGNNLIQVQLPGLGGQGHVVNRGSTFCAVSSSGKSLGCYKNIADAQARAKAQSVQRVLQIIGTTARLEEREVLQTIPPSDASYKTTPLTPRDPDTGSFQSTGDVVAYEDTNNDGSFTDGVDVKFKLGPVEITGADLTKATAVFRTSTNGATQGSTGWEIDFTLNKAGAAKFSEATKRLAGDPNTPADNKQLAIVLDGVVASAPIVNGQIPNGSGVITLGTNANSASGERDAKNLAVVLNSGSLPVQLTREEVQTVSPLLGQESLREGLIAGLVGLVALMLYLAFYYRLLGLVTWVGMAIWGVLAIGLVSLLGRTIGYALTLAGVAGIIVSLGITADSYIVFYERLKDEVRHGKTLRAAVVPAFKRSWKTIVAADIVTIIAAVVLYLLAVGSVRGFALTLGLSTALDMFVVYFFKRPTVFLISRSPFLTSLRGMGLRSGVAADPLPVAGGER